MTRDNVSRPRNTEACRELTEDIEVLSAGQILSEARQQRGYSVDDVAQRLKLRRCVVEQIEADQPEEGPVTFWRGYLRAYARLLEVDEKLVLDAFQQSHQARVQQAELQSFSQRTRKQASDSRLMAITYGLAVVLIGSSIVWWWQEKAQQPLPQPPLPLSSETPAEATQSDASLQAQQVPPSAGGESIKEVSPTDMDTQPEAKVTADSQRIKPQPLPLATLTMTFSGDCWVNVVDATGERIAYGVKVAGKVMPLTGVPPFEITLGAPHVVSIIYNDQPVDLSHFKPGRVARFTLPATQ